MSNDITPCKHGRIDCDECHDKYRGIRGSICPVFGCTIPRGIPHEHSAGVLAVMRDPGAPLTDIERAELQYHRQQAAERNDQMVQAYLDDPMTGAPKLRDALLMAGNIPRTESTSFNVPGGGSVTVDTTPTRYSDTEWTEVRRLSIAQIVGRIGTGIVLAIGVASILILSAMTAGWL